MLQRWYLAELILSKALWYQIHQKCNLVSHGWWGPVLPAGFLSLHTEGTVATSVPLPLLLLGTQTTLCSGTVQALGPEGLWV